MTGALLWLSDRPRTQTTWPGEGEETKWVQVEVKTILHGFVMMNSLLWCCRVCWASTDLSSAGLVSLCQLAHFRVLGPLVQHHVLLTRLGQFGNTADIWTAIYKWKNTMKHKEDKQVVRSIFISFGPQREYWEWHIWWMPQILFLLNMWFRSVIWGSFSTNSPGIFMKNIKSKLLNECVKLRFSICVCLHYSIHPNTQLFLLFPNPILRPKPTMNYYH